LISRGPSDRLTPRGFQMDRLQGASRWIDPRGPSDGSTSKRPYHISHSFVFCGNNSKSQKAKVPYYWKLKKRNSWSPDRD
jgi:hypothetical protein